MLSLQPCVVDNRAFVLGLDHLYREAMQRHECGELLGCARQVAAALRVTPTPFPVEGYYARSPLLTEYFRLVRTLQDVGESRTAEVKGSLAYQRLYQVMASPLYGRAQHNDKLLPVGRDPLSQAMLESRPHWSMLALTAAARAAAEATDDISLVGLAACLADPVVLTALRESVVLYAEMMVLGALHEPEIVWEVDRDLAERAGRFVRAYAALFGGELPPPVPQNAAHYWHAYTDSEIIGRCVRLGYDDDSAPIRHYHWAICPGADHELTAREFWAPEVWTTDRYRVAIFKEPRSAPASRSPSA